MGVSASMQKNQQGEGNRELYEIVMESFSDKGLLKRDQNEVRRGTE